MYPDDESSEEHPDSFYQDGSYEDSDDTNSGKGCLIIMAIILILSLLLRYLQ
jgi:hypothetical protein